MVNITNHGLSDQIHDNIRLRIINANFHIATKKNGADGDVLGPNLIQEDPQLLGPPPNKVNYYYVNGLKARSSKIEAIPIYLENPEELKNFYDHYNGTLETSIEYPEFSTSTHAKNEMLIFDKL